MKRKDILFNAALLYLVALINVGYVIAQRDTQRLGIAAFCVVMGTHWLLMWRRYYR